MMNCRTCGSQLPGTETFCDICKTENSDYEMVSDPAECDDENDTEITVEESVNVEKSSAFDTNEVPHPVDYKDIGSKSQVRVSFSDGSSICLKKIVALSLYPDIFSK